MVSAHVFIATSLDGFIARDDGDIDWLINRDAQGEDHGYDEFMKCIDAIVMGRNTYEKVLTLGPWSYTKPVYVLSTQLAGSSVPQEINGRVHFINLQPKDLMARLFKDGFKRVYIDGGKLIQSFLQAELVEDLIITQVPILIGSGRPLFANLKRDISMSHIKTVTFQSGMVQSHYRIDK